MYILYWLNIGHHKNCFKQKKSCVKNKKILRALYVHDMKVCTNKSKKTKTCFKETKH